MSMVGKENVATHADPVSGSDLTKFHERRVNLSRG